VRRNKYNARKTVVDGITFDSIAESIRYGELKILEKAGEIRDLKVHPWYPLIVEGIEVCRYIADFSYWDKRTRKHVIEDVKSAPTRTQVYRLKKKLFEALHSLRITEVVR